MCAQWCFISKASSNIAVGSIYIFDGLLSNFKNNVATLAFYIDLWFTDALLLSKSDTFSVFILVPVIKPNLMFAFSALDFFSQLRAGMCLTL